LTLLALQLFVDVLYTELSALWEKIPSVQHQSQPTDWIPKQMDHIIYQDGRLQGLYYSISGTEMQTSGSICFLELSHLNNSHQMFDTEHIGSRFNEQKAIRYMRK
jgi:hypothetical protein